MHTLGPWHATYRYSEPYGGGGTRKAWLIICSEWELHAPVSIAGDTWPEGSPGERKAKANAHLIAAAPDLLLALRDIVESHPDSDSVCGWCGRTKNGSSECDSDDCMGVQARAAIAKCSP